MKRAATVAALTAVLALHATPADAATRWVRDGSYIDHRGVRICLMVKQVRNFWTLGLWDSRGLPVLRRCGR